MKKHLSSRDLNKLSAYLDGELNASDSRKMKSRLARDPNLLTALDDLRETKNILQRIPARKIPRNFTLSPQMVAKSPPMPRAYPAFRFASALAFILLFFSAIPKFGAPMKMAEPAMMEAAPAAERIAGTDAENILEMPALAAEAPAPEESAAEEAPAMAESAIVVEEEIAAFTPTPAAEFSSTPQATQEMGKAAADQAEGGAAPILPSSATLSVEIIVTPIADGAQAFPARAVFSLWQKVLLVAAIIFFIAAFITRRVVISKWQEASK